MCMLTMNNVVIDFIGTEEITKSGLAEENMKLNVSLLTILLNDVLGCIDNSDNEMPKK